jgi:hypothetical protein
MHVISEERTQTKTVREQKRIYVLHDGGAGIMWNPDDERGLLVGGFF